MRFSTPPPNFSLIHQPQTSQFSTPPPQTNIIFSQQTGSNNTLSHFSQTQSLLFTKPSPSKLIQQQIVDVSIAATSISAEMIKTVNKNFLFFKFSQFFKYLDQTGPRSESGPEFLFFWFNPESVKIRKFFENEQTGPNSSYLIIYKSIKLEQ